MRFLSFLFLLWLCWAEPALAQRQGADAVVLTDSSQMMSTPGLGNDPDVVREIRTQTLEALTQEILQWSEETTWPGDLATLDGRNNNRPAISRIHAWRVVILSDGRSILWIPAADNQDLPYNIRPVHDIYMVILNAGIRPSGGTRPLPMGAALPAASSFQGFSAVEFVDSSEMMSTPTLDASMQAQIRTQTNEARLQDVLAYCNENSWPSAIQTLDGRNNNRAIIVTYKAYLLAKLEGNQSVLWIPASENRTMPSGFVPTHDFYMLINNVGIQVVSPPSGIVQRVVSNKSDFGSQLNTLILGLKDDFSGVMGAKVPEEGGMLAGLNVEYESNISLDGAIRTYLSKTFSGIRLIAVYGDFRDSKQGMQAYDALVQRVKTAELPCCRFVTNEQVLDNLRSTTFLPFDPEQKMAGLNNAVVDIQLIQQTNLDDQRQSYTSYRLLLSIYRLK